MATEILGQVLYLFHEEYLFLGWERYTPCDPPSGIGEFYYSSVNP
jgi:hypothetical protein